MFTQDGILKFYFNYFDEDDSGTIDEAEYTHIIEVSLNVCAHASERGRKKERQSSRVNAKHLLARNN